MTSSKDNGSDEIVCPDCGKAFTFERVYNKHRYSCDGTRVTAGGYNKSHSSNRTSASSSAGVSPCPLTEYYESLRSIRSALELIHPSIGGRNTNTFSGQYYKVVSSIISQGHPNSESTPGYGEQHPERADHSVSDYRDKYGNGDWVTSYPAIDSKSPQFGFFKQLGVDISTDSLFIRQPIPPTEDTALPVVVDSEDGLIEALRLLSQLPARPRVSLDENLYTSVPVKEIYTTDVTDSDMVDLTSLNKE